MDGAFGCVDWLEDCTPEGVAVVSGDSAAVWYVFSFPVLLLAPIHFVFGVIRV